MVVGYPDGGRVPLDPHSIVSIRLGVERMRGGVLDGPVYRTIFDNLIGVKSLVDQDEYAPFNTGSLVYHDDYGDFSTNEPIMDGTANLIYLVSTRSR
jgi:hypothetical protein